MRHGELDNEEKARAVLCRCGHPGNACAGMTADEQSQLAAIYDECVAPERQLKERIDKFWGNRRERLEAAKATDDVQPEGASLFRNSTQAKKALADSAPDPSGNTTSGVVVKAQQEAAAAQAAK